MIRKPLFQDFHEHDTIEILSTDHREKQIKYKSAKYQKSSSATYLGIGYFESSLVPGRCLKVQFGKVTKSEARLSYRLMAGDKKISALKYPSPKATKMAISIMKWSMGKDEADRQLGYYSERANSNHSHVTYEGINGKTITLLPGWGTLRAEMEFDCGYINEMGIHLSVDLPEIIIQSATGRRIDELIDHPCLKDSGNIGRIKRKDSGGVFICPEISEINIKDYLEGNQI